MEQGLNRDWMDAVREKVLPDGAAPSPVSWEAVGRRMRRAAALRRGALVAAVLLPALALLLWSPWRRPIPAIAPSSPSPVILSEANKSTPGIPTSPTVTPTLPTVIPDRPIVIPDLIGDLPEPLLALDEPMAQQLPQDTTLVTAAPVILSEANESTPITPTFPTVTPTPPPVIPDLIGDLPEPLLALDEQTARRRPRVSVALGGSLLPAGHLSSQVRTEYNLYSLMLIQENTYYLSEVTFGKSFSSNANYWNTLHQHRLEILEQAIPKQTMLTDEITWHHDLPLGLALSVRTDLTSRLSVETGLEYTYLHSVEELSEEARQFMADGVLLEDSNHVEYLDQQLHFVGIPLRLTYRAWSPGRWDVYAGVGVKGDKCIKAQLGVEKLEERRLQWSAEAFGGIQYRLWDRTHLYFQPALNWYFTQTDLVTYRTENPFSLSLHAGLRFDL